ncbi:MAG TPA: TlpA disulfide reductase family protein [Polyangiales bacterium]|nr:TlpA disulfide reductase family protein [Polyangiales bacterium]
MKADKLAAVVAFLLGAPFAFMMVRGFAEGELRRKEIPLRALIGDEAFENYRDGDKAKLHYLGNDRLAPDFALKDKDGKEWRLKDHRGKTVVLNFWTITCQPCVEEMPSFEQLALMAKERDDLEVVAVSTDKGWSDVAAVIKPGSQLKVLFDPDKAVVREKFGTRLYPETWVIDPDGVIRVRVDGARDWSAPVALEMIERLSS